MTSDKTPTTVELLTEDQIETALKQSVCTRIESYGELVYEPGMSEDERKARTRDVLWRHGGADRARAAAELHVQEGRWTQAEADEHLRRQEEQARQLRELVLRCDEERLHGTGGGG